MVRECKGRECRGGVRVSDTCVYNCVGNRDWKGIASARVNYQYFGRA